MRKNEYSLKGFMSIFQGSPKDDKQKNDNKSNDNKSNDKKREK